MEFSQLKRFVAQGFNRIPITRTVLADKFTAVSAYAKFRAPYSFLLESLQGGEKWGRYSIIGLPCNTLVRVHGDEVEVERHGEVIETQHRTDPLAFVEEELLND